MKECLVCQNEYASLETDCPYCNGRMLKLSEEDIKFQQVTLARLRVVYPPPYFMDWQVKVDVQIMGTVFCAEVMPYTDIEGLAGVVVAMGATMRELYVKVQGIKWGRV